MINRGILLTSIGHPHYGRMAYNLAVTLKAAEPAMPIALVTDHHATSHLSDAQMKHFDHVITTTESGNMTGANNIRLSYPLITPFKETLALDVDMLWLSRQPSEAFDLLADRDFTAVNEGYVDLDADKDHTSGTYTFWADKKEMKDAYGLTGHLYQLRGEFNLFRNSPAVKKMYANAKKIFQKPKVKVKTHGEAVTEEFALNVATCQAGITPHRSQWEPAYWPGRRGNIVPVLRELHEDYYALSVGGNQITPSITRTYDLIMQAAAHKQGLRHQFPLKAKRKYLPERISA